MTTNEIRQKLYDYIKLAENKKVKAIYTMLEAEIEDVNKWWDNEDFITKLDLRSSEYKSGEVKSVNWEAAKRQILSSSKTRKKK